MLDHEHDPGAGPPRVPRAVEVWLVLMIAVAAAVICSLIFPRGGPGPRPVPLPDGPALKQSADSKLPA